MLKKLLFVWIVLVGSVYADTQYFRCTDKEGHSVFSDKPCSTEAVPQTIRDAQSITRDESRANCAEGSNENGQNNGCGNDRQYWQQRNEAIGQDLHRDELKRRILTADRKISYMSVELDKKMAELKAQLNQPAPESDPTIRVVGRLGSEMNDTGPRAMRNRNNAQRDQAIAEQMEALTKQYATQIEMEQNQRQQWQRELDALGN